MTNESLSIPGFRTSSYKKNHVLPNTNLYQSFVNESHACRYSSNETGYVSDGAGGPRGYETQYTQPDFSHLQQSQPLTGRPPPSVPMPTGEDPTYVRHYRDEVETEIF